jgi:3-oxoacyl-[acyl-carrier protein] reductase
MNKVALITGSSRGIGRAEALRLARDGYAVCVNYIRRADKAAEVLDILKSEGLPAIAVQADVADRDAVAAMVRRTEETFGPVTLLVNNAGIAEQHQFQDITPEYWKRIFDVNLGGAFNTIQAVLPHMLHEHAGCIVNTASIWGLHGASCEAAYSSTKHAIAGLTKSLAAELGPTHIRVNAVAPGVINTDMVQPLGSETLDSLARTTPLARLGRPEDIADAVSFLASDRASFITGQILACDGGFINL